MFTIQYRDAIRDDLLGLAQSDSHISGGALVGSLAMGEGDRWADLDLTFGVSDEVPIQAMLEDWTRHLHNKYSAVHLFDLPFGPSIYRVFLLPGCLQLDLSFTPASQFGALGPQFKLLFGKAVERPFPQPPPLEELFGYAVHHALRARFCIERGHFWQAEYWISSMRDYALSLACRRRGLPSAPGRGFDQLPVEMRDSFAASLVSTLQRGELLRALGAAIDGLLQEVDGVQELAGKAEPHLRELMSAWEA